MPSKWENFAHNGLICFFQHNYIPTFEQRLWDRVCVLSAWFGDICGSRRDFCMFYKRSQILFVAAAYEMTNVIPRAYKQKCTRNWPPPPCEAVTNCAVWSPPYESAGAAAISIMILDTLCSKKWYDMPHVGVVFIRFSGPRFHALVVIRLFTINRHARCSL